MVTPKDPESGSVARLPAISVLEWARERLANTYRLAAEKTGTDRDGWLEDAAYWREIVKALGTQARPGKGFAAKMKNDACEGCGGSLVHGRYVTLDDVHLCRSCFYAVPKRNLA